MKTLTVLWVIFWLSACGGSTPPADPCKGKWVEVLVIEKEKVIIG